MALPIIRSTPLTSSGQLRTCRSCRERTQYLAAKAEALCEAAESLPAVADELRQLAQPYLSEAGTTALGERSGDAAASPSLCPHCHPMRLKESQ